MSDARDVLHAAVRRLCGSKPVNRCLIVENAALVEFEKSIVLLVICEGRIQRLRLNDTQARTFCRTLCDIYE